MSPTSITTSRIGALLSHFSVFAAVGLPALAHSEHPRIAEARQLKGEEARALAKKEGLSYPIPSLYFRAIKSERVLEIWGSSASSCPHVLLAKFPVAGMSGGLGPKRRQGDLQVPEGFYHIDRYNPNSRFLLSLGINYPNRSDRLLSRASDLGGDIFIHGGVSSARCLAMTDDAIRLIFLLAYDTRQAGQTKIPVHIYPFPMDGPQWARAGTQPPALRLFWGSLRPGWISFENTRIPPRPGVDPKSGRYRH